MAQTITERRRRIAQVRRELAAARKYRAKRPGSVAAGRIRHLEQSLATLKAYLRVALERRAAAGTCRVCGCTDTNACFLRSGETCRWVEPDLCSASQCVRAKNGRGRRKARA